jgi:hypothetical protein
VNATARATATQAHATAPSGPTIHPDVTATAGRAPTEEEWRDFLSIVRGAARDAARDATRALIDAGDLIGVPHH